MTTDGDPVTRPAGATRSTAVVVLAIAVVAHMAVPVGSSAATLTYLAAPVLAVGSAATAARSATGSRRRGWILVTVGLAMWLTSETIRTLLWDDGGLEHLGITDVLYLSAYPLLAGGLSLVLGDRRRRLDTLGTVDALIVSGAVLVLSWTVLFEPAVTDPSAPESLRFAALAFLIADLALVVVVVRVAVEHRARSRADHLLFAGVAVWVGSDAMAFWYLTGPGLEVGDPPGVGWMLAYGLFSAAALTDQTSPRPPAHDDSLGVGWPRIVALAGSALTPPALVLVQIVRGVPPERSVASLAGVATIVMFTLVVARMWGLMHAVRRLTREAGEERFASMVAHLGDLITLVTPDGRIAYASPAVRHVWGYEPGEVAGRHASSMVDREDAEHFDDHLRRATDLPRGGTIHFETRALRRDGTRRWADVTVANLVSDPNVGGLVLTVRDVDDHRSLADQLHHQAFHDPLTGLANRSLFVDRVAHALDRRSSESSPGIGVMFIDLDDFKGINDELGHEAGDALLRSVAERIRTCLRVGDTPARLGGDEFAVLIDPVEGPTDAATLARRIIEVLALPLAAGDGLELPVRASIGIALASAPTTTHELLRSADTAMYAAKHDGKATYRLYDPELAAEADRRLSLRSDLRRALALDELRLVYQPIVDLETRAVVGAEALLRWRHPVRGEVPPPEFIPIAEASGLMGAIGSWVLATACRTATVWQGRDRPVPVSVNVSPLQFARDTFAADVRGELGRSGLDPRLLTIEITEAALIEDEVHTGRQLGELSALGVGVAIDDFGTGYCSVSHLQRLPIDQVKIDRTFVDELDGSDRTSLASTILTLTEVLAVRSVAEGIETEEQVTQLVGMRCELGQGFHLGAPLEAEAFADLLDPTRTGGDLPET